jgi:hypothetical protein
MARRTTRTREGDAEVTEDMNPAPRTIEPGAPWPVGTGSHPYGNPPLDPAGAAPPEPEATDPESPPSD